MCWLLRELDSGPVSMAAGSRVTLLNIHDTDVIMEQVRRFSVAVMKQSMSSVPSSLVQQFRV